MRAVDTTRGLVLPFALLGLLMLAGTGVAWWFYGERIFIERLIAGIAGCF